MQTMTTVLVTAREYDKAVEVFEASAEDNLHLVRAPDSETDLVAAVRDHA